MRPRPLFALAGGLLLGGLLGPGCTPDSSGSPPPSDTTPPPVERRSQPSRHSAAESSPAPRAQRGRSPTAVEDAPQSLPTDTARSVAQRLEDASVAARVKQALARVRTLRRFDFSPTVVRGHLVLRGDVDTRRQYRRAERVASNVDGVTAVTNQMTVAGRAVTDADGSSTSPAGSEAVYHTVHRGETLWRISREYDVSVQQLRALNDLSGSLQPGQRIRVR